MVSYAKYSLVPTDEPDKAGAALAAAGAGPNAAHTAGGTHGLFGNIFTNTHTAPSINRSTLPPPPNSAFDYSSAFNFKSAFDYNSSGSSQYQSAFDYGYGRKEAAAEPAIKATKRHGLTLPCDATACLSAVVTALSCVFICLTFPCSLPFCFKRLEQWERIVVFRLGRLRGVFGPGLVFVIPWSDRLNRVDMRTKAFSVPPQQVITCDNGIVEVGCEVKYRVSDVKRLTTTVTTPEHGLRNFGKTVLLNVLTKHTIKEMERDRAGLAAMVQRDLNARVLEWGIEIGQVDLSQVTVLKEPEPNDPLKPLLGALGSFAGGGAAAGSGSTHFAVPPGGALGAVGAKDMGGAAALLSGLLSGSVVSPTTSSRGGATTVNIPGLAGSPAGGNGPPGYGFGKETEDESAPLLPRSSAHTPTGCGGSVSPCTPLGQYLHALVSAAHTADLTHGIYRLAVEGTPHGSTAVFVIFIGAGVRQVVEGDLPSVTPDVSVTVSQEDLHAIFSGTLPPLQAYLSGRLSVQGSVQMLMGLQALQDAHQTMAAQGRDGGVFVA